MWFLRSWKIGQIQQIAAEQGKRPGDIDAASAEPVGEGAGSFVPKRFKSDLLRRLFITKRV